MMVHRVRIDVVFDVYRETSIKNAEWCKWGSNTAIQYRNVAGGHNIQQWKKFLCSSYNKSSLIKFILEQWKLPKCREKLHDTVCNLRGCLQKDEKKLLGGSQKTEVHTRRSILVDSYMHCTLQILGQMQSL